MHLNRTSNIIAFAVTVVAVILATSQTANAQSGSVTFRSPHTSTSFSYGPGGRSVSGSAYTNSGFGVSFNRHDPNYGSYYGPPPVRYGGGYFDPGYNSGFERGVPLDYFATSPGPAIIPDGNVSFRPYAAGVVDLQSNYAVEVVNNTSSSIMLLSYAPVSNRQRGRSDVGYANRTTWYLRGPMIIRAYNSDLPGQPPIGQPQRVSGPGVLTIDMGTTPNYGGFDNGYGNPGSYTGLAEMPTSGYYAPSSRPSCLGSIAVLQAAIDRGQLPSDSAIRVVMNHAQQYGLSDQEMAMMQRVEASLRDLCARRGIPLPPPMTPQRGYTPSTPGNDGGDGFHNPLLDRADARPRGTNAITVTTTDNNYSVHFVNHKEVSAVVDITNAETHEYYHTLTIPAGESRDIDLHGRCKLVITSHEGGDDHSAGTTISSAGTVNIE